MTCAGREGWSRREWLAALALFAASAVVVAWQNSRLGVLWDLSYILENSYRISAGDVPYRDFPFPYAPLTFLTQAAIMRLTGRVFWHHVVYAAAAGGLASALSYRLVWRVARGRLPRPGLAAFLLCAPLAVLGIYAIFPHPFYDPDCTLSVLLCLLLLLRAERKGFTPARSFLTGASLVLPLFVKQNTGLAFLAGSLLALALLLLMEVWNRRPARGHLWLLAGVCAGLAAALALVHLTAGLDNYVRWTVRFAAERRTPPLADMLGVYRDWLLPVWLACFVCGALLWRRNRGGRPWLACAAALLMTLPFVWAVVYLFLDGDASEQAERLQAVWPFVLVASAGVALAGARRTRGVALVLPFILIATAHGAFMSQQLWGSTYGIWPLLVLLFACTLATLRAFTDDESPARSHAWVVLPCASIVCASLLAAGSRYVWTSERLDYADVHEGALTRSSLPALAGLSVRGAWLKEFEELVAYTDREIPRDEGILMLPGEDLFYFTTGRRPRFPALMFDRTVNPYSAEEVLALARERGVNWLVVKGNLQLEDEQVDDDKERMVEVLEQDFKQVESLSNYDIYRRKTDRDREEEKEDEQDDDDDEGAQDSGLQLSR